MTDVIAVGAFCNYYQGGRVSYLAVSFAFPPPALLASGNEMKKKEKKKEKSNNKKARDCAKTL
jgi:hypothetical protein